MLGAIFGATVRLRNSLYDSGRLRARRLAGPVVSVGNISVGGAGKTPFVIALGELLKSRGLAFDVLTRGYRRASKGILEVDPAGSPLDFGDEPLLIARRLNVPVIVGESRFAAGRWSEAKYGVRLHLLDDGFQHRQLARDFDIVLITAQDVRDRLLPAGRLREPLSSIRRANAVVITDDMNGADLPLKSDQLLWRIRRGIQILPLHSFAVGGPPLRTPAPPAVKSSSETETEALLAFCAIARPQRFFDDLRSAGLHIADTVSFPDHHRYTDADVGRVLAAAKQSNTASFVTTEKDLINLGSLASQLQPLSIARVTLDLLDADSVLARLRLQKSKIETQK